jgi:hypothetical protein
MRLSEYVEIQDKFIEKFGHDKAIDIMHSAIVWIRMAEDIDEFDFVYNLTPPQSKELKAELRRMWTKHAKA